MRHILAIIVLLCASSAFAAPAVTSVTGTVADGQGLTIYGSGFGSHTLNIVWTGGPSGLIESSPTGDIVSGANGWTNGWGAEENISTADAYYCCAAPEITTSIAHSGSKAIYSHYGTAVTGWDNYDSGLWFDWRTRFGTDYSTLYISWWARYNQTGATDWQWKMYRFKPNTSNHLYEDTTGEFVAFPNPGYLRELNFKDTGGSHTYWCSSCGSQQLQNWVGGTLEQNRWYRRDIFINPETNDSSNNGSFVHEIYDPANNGHAYAHNVDGNANIGIISRRWIVLHQYYGNVTGTRNAQMYMDDIYMSDTRARIEVCSESTWAARQHCEIQIPTEWAAGYITATVNRGSFAANASAYLYVVDSTGTANATGYPITFGDSGDMTAPVVSDVAPSGSQTYDSGNQTISLTTDENATCRYGSTSLSDYYSYTNIMTGGGTTSHSANLTGLSEGTTYTRYGRCIDAAGNVSSLVTWQWSYPAAPSADVPNIKGIRIRGGKIK